MKKYFPALVLFATFGLMAVLGLYADEFQLKVPTGQTGQPVGDSSLAGGTYTVANGTVAVVTNPCMLSHMILSPDTTSAGWQIFNASATVNNTDANRVLPEVEAESTTLPTYRVLDPPLRLGTGLSVDWMGTAIGSTATFVCTTYLQ